MNKHTFIPLLFSLLLLMLNTSAQYNSTQITGVILDESNHPLPGVSISILGSNKGIISSDSGSFKINVAPEKALALIFTHTGFREVQRNFFLSKGETEKCTVIMVKDEKTMDQIIITDEKERKETGLVKINPKNTALLPSTTGGIESLIKTLVGSNNELTSQYNVRGGNYDENLIYINDFEVYRPYLVSNGQQEGLSFINPELTRNVNFYTGGFQAKYGDRMSSVLDIQYKKPVSFGGSVYISPLEQGISITGNINKSKLTYLLGARNKSNANLLKNQPTVGAYIPAASDWQSIINWKINSKLSVELLSIFSSSKFIFYPESVKKTTTVFSPLYTSNLGLDTYFEGREKDRYQASLNGLSVSYQPNNKCKLKWLLSRYQDDESENFDITGSYLFGDRDFDNNSSTFGEIINPLGAGMYQQYARNRLNISIWNLGHRGSFEVNKHFFQWGLNAEKATIKDQIQQFEYRDSAGYSLPYQPGQLAIYNATYRTNTLNIQKLSGFFQNNWHQQKNGHDLTIQSGIRFNWNNLNRELLLSPRAQMSFKPNWKKDWVFRTAAGYYAQPPFYRELTSNSGKLNSQLLAQKSIQWVTGADHQWKGVGNRPFRLSVEAYFKSIRDLIPYDIENVKISYLGNNQAKAYATGLEFRLFTELLKDAESWLSVGFMRTRENLDNDYYYNYLNAAGELITPQTADQIIADSVRQDIGYVRRPTDRLLTLGLFLQDYLSTNKNFKVHLNMLYGSNMPFNLPDNPKFRNALIIDPYMRVDIGFSARLLDEKSNRRSHSPFRNFENLWLSFEVFNLINKANTISYQLIKDYANNTYALPNQLTPRLLNLKLIARF